MRILYLALLCLCLSLSPAYAADAPDVKKIEDYLKNISTLKAHFVQTANDGTESSGTFLLKRPGRMRFDYEPPISDFIVADKLLVHYYDGKMKQQSSVPISKSLADFFLRTNLKLDGDIRVTNVKRENGLLNIVLVQSKDPLAGSLTLAFSERPLQLKKWLVVDAQGLVTKIDLLDVQEGIKLDNDLFHYYDPADKKVFINK